MRRARPTAVTPSAAHVGHTIQALPTATANSSISIAILIGPGVAIPVVFLSPGVLNSAGRATKTRTVGIAYQPDPSRRPAAHGPAIQATTSITNRVPDEAAVS